MNASVADDTRPEFVDRVDDEVKCCLCQRVMWDPIQTECGHRMCRSCLDEYLKEEGSPTKCPVNEKDCAIISESNTGPDFALKRKLLMLKVYCPHSTFGCDVTLLWKQLIKHLRNDCEYRMVECSTCHEEIPKLDLDAHRADDCRLVRCSFHDIGCKFRGKADENLREHEDAASKEHLGLALMALTAQQRETVELKEKIRNVELLLVGMKATLLDLESASESGFTTEVATCADSGTFLWKIAPFSKHLTEKSFFSPFFYTKPYLFHVICRHIICSGLIQFSS